MASQQIFPHNTRVLLQRIAIGFCAVTVLSIGAPAVHAAQSAITYRYKHHLFTINPADMRDWKTKQEVWTYRGTEVEPPQELRVDADIIPPLPAGFVRAERETWNSSAIEQTIARRIAAAIDREPGAVVIRRSATGAIVFDGTGFPGQTTDISLAASLTIKALEDQIADIELPVIETQPRVTVEDRELKDLGIRELVTIGESDYSGSTQNRIHNIRVGLNRFNGHLIKQGETFSFVQVLGRVDGTTGYRKELTILASLMKRTEPLQSIVLRVIDIGEADRFCIFFTREAGRKSARAKSVRKTTSRLGGVLLPFRHVSIELVESANRATVVSAVDRGDLVPPSDFPLLVRLEQGIELLLALTEEDEPLPAVFDLLREFILLATEPSIRPLVPFQLRLLHLLGHLPANTDEPRYRDLPADVQSYVQACTHIADLRTLCDLLIDHPLLDGFLQSVIEAEISRPLKSEGMGE